MPAVAMTLHEMATIRQARERLTWRWCGWRQRVTSGAEVASRERLEAFRRAGRELRMDLDRVEEVEALLEGRSAAG